MSTQPRRVTRQATRTALARVQEEAPLPVSAMVVEKKPPLGSPPAAWRLEHRYTRRSLGHLERLLPGSVHQLLRRSSRSMRQLIAPRRTSQQCQALSRVVYSSSRAKAD